MNSFDNDSQSTTFSSNLSSTDTNSTVITVAYFLISGVSLIHFATLTISSFNLIVLGSIKLLHPNLKFVLMCQSGAVFLFEFFRIMEIFQKFLSNDIFNPCFVFLQMTLFFFGMFRTLTIHILFIERLMAIIFLDKYESYKKITFSICWFTFATVLCLLNVLTNGQSWTSTTLNLITMFFTLSLSLVECIFIAIIGIYCREKYEKQMENVQQLNNFLGARYQMAENIKTSKQLLPVFFCNSLNILSGIFPVFNFVCKWTTDAHLISMLMAVAIGLCSVLNAIAEAVIINHHPALKRRFIFLFHRFFRCHSHGQVSDSFVTNTTTKSTNADIIHDFNEHFKLLELQWK